MHACGAGDEKAENSVRSAVTVRYFLDWFMLKSKPEGAMLEAN